MKKVSAVDWLVQRWEKFQQEGEKMTWNQIIQITKLAKEMEKEQIIDSINNFQNNHNITAVGNLATGEGYYKNIFEKKQQ
jgi:hypothetical protein